MKRSVVGIIPARSGSKRLPGKNLKDFDGKPLIAWTILAALESECIGEVVVSTDNPEIAAVAKAYGASVPFLRPPELATDNAKTMDVVTHLLEWSQANHSFWDDVILLQPTSPLRTSNHIDDAFALFSREHIKAVISVCEIEHPVEWVGELGPNREMDKFFPTGEPVRSQEYRKRYRLNGSLYIAGRSDLQSHRTFFLPNGTYAFLMSKTDSVDIDDEEDFLFAEYLFKRRETYGSNP